MGWIYWDFKLECSIFYLRVLDMYIKIIIKFKKKLCIFLRSEFACFSSSGKKGVFGD